MVLSGNGLYKWGTGRTNAVGMITIRICVVKIGCRQDMGSRDG